MRLLTFRAGETPMLLPPFCLHVMSPSSVYFHYMSQMGLERTFTISCFCSNLKKRLSAARSHFTLPWFTQF